MLRQKPCTVRSLTCAASLCNATPSPNPFPRCGGKHSLARDHKSTCTHVHVHVQWRKWTRFLHNQTNRPPTHSTYARMHSCSSTGSSIIGGERVKKELRQSTTQVGESPLRLSEDGPPPLLPPYKKKESCPPRHRHQNPDQQPKRKQKQMQKRSQKLKWKEKQKQRRNRNRTPKRSRNHGEGKVHGRLRRPPPPNQPARSKGGASDQSRVKSRGWHVELTCMQRARALEGIGGPQV